MTVRLSLSVVFSLDAEQKEQLIEVIEKLLKDKSTVSTHRACDAVRPLEGAPVKRLPSQLSIPQLIRQCHGLLTPT